MMRMAETQSETAGQTNQGSKFAIFNEWKALHL